MPRITRAHRARVLEHAAAEDERFREAHGDELPEQLSTPEGRQHWLREAPTPGRALRARSALDSRTAAQGLKVAGRRLEEEHEVHIKANAA
jgi:hypothetical protein